MQKPCQHIQAHEGVRLQPSLHQVFLSIGDKTIPPLSKKRLQRIM